MTAWPQTCSAAISLHWRWRLSVGLAALAHGALALALAGPDSQTTAAVELRPVELLTVDIDIENEVSGSRVAEAAEPQSATPARGASKCSSTSARSASKRRPAPTPPAVAALPPQPSLAESAAALVLAQGGGAEDDDSGTLHHAGRESRVDARGRFGPGIRTASGQGRGTSGPVAQRPRLRTSGDPCRGLFPFSAHEDSGLVTVAVDVSRTGSPAHAHVVAERPAGEGFGAAARACATRLAFTPALGANGAPMDARAVVRLKFARN